MPVFHGRGVELVAELLDAAEPQGDLKALLTETAMVLGELLA